MESMWPIIRLSASPLEWFIIDKRIIVRGLITCFTIDFSGWYIKWNTILCDLFPNLVDQWVVQKTYFIKLLMSNNWSKYHQRLNWNQFRIFQKMHNIFFENYRKLILRIKEYSIFLVLPCRCQQNQQIGYSSFSLSASNGTYLEK